MIRTILLASSLCVTTAASAHPLEDAAHEALTLCARMDGVETIEQCMGTASPSPYRAQAKEALQRLFNERAAFMKLCDTGRGMLERCQEQADLFIWTGTLRDFKWAVQHLDQPASR